MIKCINKQIHKYIGYMNECTYNTYIYIYRYVDYIHIHCSGLFYMQICGNGFGGPFL